MRECETQSFISVVFTAQIYERTRDEFLPRETRETTHTFRVLKTLNNFFPLVFFFRSLLLCLVRWEKRLQCDKALASLRFVVLSLFREREREREKKRALSKKRQFLFVCCCCCSLYSLSILFRQSVKREREHMKASSSKSQETDDASPLSERQKQRTLGELRFRFRASALKQSPSSDALLHDGEEEDFLEDQLARYVEPPELPTLAMHKVFGTFLLEAFSYMRNV